MAEQRQLRSNTITRSVHAGKLVAETHDLGIGIMNDLVHLRAQHRIFVGETSREKVLVNASNTVSSLAATFRTSFVSHLLRRLIAVECQSTASAFHYNAGAEATQDTRLVILRWIQLRNDCVVWIRKLSLTCRTDSSSAIRTREPKAL